MGRAAMLQLLLLLMAAGGAAAGGPEVHSLRGSWQLGNGNGSLSLQGEVPGCVHTALHGRGLIQVRPRAAGRGRLGVAAPEEAPRPAAWVPAVVEPGAHPETTTPLRSCIWRCRCCLDSSAPLVAKALVSAAHSVWWVTTTEQFETGPGVHIRKLVLYVHEVLWV